MGEDADDFRETMGLQYIRKFKLLLYEKVNVSVQTRSEFGTGHFKTEGAIYQEKDEVGYLSDINHSIEIGFAFYECQAPFLATNYCNWALDVIERLFSVPPDETLHERGLAHAWRADDCDNDWRRLVLGSAVYEGNV